MSTVFGAHTKCTHLDVISTQFSNVDNGRAFLSAKFKVLSDTPNIQAVHAYAFQLAHKLLQAIASMDKLALLILSEF